MLRLYVESNVFQAVIQAANERENRELIRVHSREFAANFI
jgi:hypothetical protein